MKNTSDENQSQSNSEIEVDIFESDADSNNNTDTDIPFIQIVNDSNIEINHIYHLSDIHIRNTQRHTEYQEVFFKTYSKIRSLIGSQKKSSLIVLTGDIIHTKTELAPETFDITYHFFRNLSELATVILIPGNHDCNLSNKNRLDALSPIIDNGKLDNIIYLKKSGFYQYHNLIFGITNIYDDTLVKADKIDNNIWDSVTQQHKYKIALYHGAVHGARTDVGYRMNRTDLLAEDFDGYDYVLLGDIHKFQYMNDRKTIAYAGSLIQQSYGETLDKHGVLQWNLSEGTSKLHEIPNDYGYCTLQITNGHVISANKEIKIPPKPRIRFILDETNQIQYQDILKQYEEKYQIQEIIKENNFRTKIYSVCHKQKKFKEKVTAYSTQETIIRAYLEKKGLDQTKIDSILDLHKKIYQQILGEKKDQVADIMHNTIKNQKWNLLELRFSNTLSYGKNNVIDFKNYDPNKIIGIVAPNHYGKSAILDIILFCLFDKCSRGDRRDILNKNENSMYCSLLFNIGSKKYLIERIGHRGKNKLTVKIDVNFYVITQNKNGKEITEKLNGLDKNNTNKKIVELVGDYTDYLTTCFCLQQNRNLNFIDMTQLQKKEYLNDILKLNVFENCYTIAKDKSKELTGQLKLLEQKIGTMSLDDMKKLLKRTINEIRQLQSQKNFLKEELLSYFDHIFDKFHEPTFIQFDELKEYNLTTEKNILDTIKQLTRELKSHQKIHIDYDENTKELFELKKKLSEFEETTDYKRLTDNIKNVNCLMQQKETLFKDLSLIEDQYKNLEQNNILKKQLNDILVSLNNSLSDNLNKSKHNIDELKILIRTLEKKIKLVDPSVENKLVALQKQYKETNDIIATFFDKFISCQHLDHNGRNKLLHTIQIKESFAKHVRTNLEQINQSVEVETDMIHKIKSNETKWLDKHNKWLENTSKLIENSETDIPDLTELIKKSKEIRYKIMCTECEIIDLHQNQFVREQIDTYQKKLESLLEMERISRQIKELEAELNSIIDSDKKILHNEQIQKEIGEIDKEIRSYTDFNDGINHRIEKIKDEIITVENKISQCEKIIEQNKKISNHIVLLHRHSINYINWTYLHTHYHKLKKSKNILDHDINILTTEIEKKQVQIVMYKKDIEQYLSYRKDFDDKSVESNLYQLYVQIMNPNGLPYEILKTYLPLIESDINQILHSIVDFDIEFMFYDESQLETHKMKQLKTNMGCIDINICYRDMKPYNIQLASGFEKFIIGLAIRMTLCQISLTAKPNFLIIDEGWSCLDNENLSNIGTIMNYIKTRYEHVIIISHLEELKNQIDYIINIDRIKGYSHVNTLHTLKKSKKKFMNAKILE